MKINLDFLQMADNYEERKVARDIINDYELDTCLVVDRALDYESAVSHKDFNNGDWIVLGWADTLEAAKLMHNEWVKAFKEDDDINELTDAYTGITYKRKEC